MENDDVLSPVIGRRKLLKGAAGALGIVGLSRLVAAQPIVESAAAPSRRDIADFINPEDAHSMCVVTPSETQGPYYLNLNLVRRDITEGYAGLPVKLFIRVVSAATCLPIANAAVDVWHANAAGVYSGFSQPGANTTGLTFLRGVQTTDANGLVVFNTVFPGWYQGRTTHIHVKVRPTGSTELTTQMYYRDGLARLVYTLSPYNTHGQSTTTNAQDGLFLHETVMSVLGLTSGTLYTDLTIGV